MIGGLMNEPLPMITAMGDEYEPLQVDANCLLKVALTGTDGLSPRELKKLLRLYAIEGVVLYIYNKDGNSVRLTQEMLE